MQILKYILIAILAVIVIFLSYMGLGEILSGDNSGASHLVVAAVFCVGIYLIARTLRKK
jgi:formate/nitrite transporter FocA (FNT family)